MRNKKNKIVLNKDIKNNTNKLIRSNSTNNKIINIYNPTNSIRENKKIYTETEQQVKSIIKKNEKKEIEKEIENEYIKNKNKILQNKIIKNIKNILIKKVVISKSKVIVISGVAGVGKSIFTINLVKTIEEQNKKILIIDFDFLNNSIETLLGIKTNKKMQIKREEYRNKNQVNDFEYINQISGINTNKKINRIKVKKDKINNKNNTYKINQHDINEKNMNENNINDKIKKIIIKVNSHTDLISNIDTLLKQNEIEKIELLKIIKNLKAKYDFIIIDIDNNYYYLKSIIDEIHKIIIITEPNILQIKKSQNFLENNIKKLNIEEEKINIVINKVKKDSLSFNILKEVFKEYNIIGKINFINNYNTLINQNMKSIFIEKHIKKQYKKICKKINENSKTDKYYIEKINTE